MNRNLDRERDLQDFLDGQIDEAELRRRLGVPTDPGAPLPELERELAGYRAVGRSLEREPEFRLPADFARRTARLALAERRTDREERLMAALLAGSSAAAAGAAAAAIALLVSASGLEVGRLMGGALASGGQVPAALGGTIGVGALLFALDRVAARGRGARGSTT